MAYIEMDTQSGVLGYDIKNDTAIVSAYRGRDVSICIPEQIEYGTGTVPVTAIKSKSFLSNKFIHEITVPETVFQIDDWAFARCSNLERIYLHRSIVLGNGVFKDCNKLSQVYITGDGEKSVDVSFLLAAVIQLLDDRFLFDLQLAGSDEWLENWDHRMDVILNTPDDEGFIALLACGEEDYEGRDNTLEGYLTNSRRRKVHICMVRLLHDYGLNDTRREALRTYLYEHRAGMTYSVSAYDRGAGYSDGYTGRTVTSQIEDFEISASDSTDPMDESWRVVLEEHGDEEEYYRLLIDCNCIDETNLDIMLGDMGEKHARMKAFLLREKSTKKASDFFDSLDL